MKGVFSWQSPSSRLVLTAVLDLLAERGYEGLTIAELRERSGVAGQAIDDDLDLDGLIVVALQHIQILSAPPPSGSLEADLQALLNHWRTPRTRDELAIAAVLSAAEWRPRLKDAVAETLDRQVARAAGGVLNPALTGGAMQCHLLTLAWILRGLVLERLRTGPRSAVDLHGLIAFLLRGMGQYTGTNSPGDSQ